MSKIYIGTLAPIVGPTTWGAYHCTIVCAALASIGPAQASSLVAPIRIDNSMPQSVIHIREALDTRTLAPPLCTTPHILGSRARKPADPSH